MKWLGGVQSAEESADDAAYFTSCGKIGPTFWVIERQCDKRFLGFCGVLHVDEEDSPVHGELEIGWRLREDCQANGYAFEAAGEAFRFAFEELNAPRVIARIALRNIASRSLATALRMKSDLALRHTPEGENEPLLVYELARLNYGASRRF